MKLKFKQQAYQSDAVKAVVDCFAGQPRGNGFKYAIDPGRATVPKAFHIPTPVGNYNPDWAIAFQAGKVKHIYFVAETKGSMSSMDLRKIEAAKIECARRFFAKITSEQVKYDVVDSYGKLMELVS